MDGLRPPGLRVDHRRCFELPGMPRLHARGRRRARRTSELTGRRARRPDWYHALQRASSGASSSCAPAPGRSTSARSSGPTTSRPLIAPQAAARAAPRRRPAPDACDRPARRVPDPPAAAAARLGRQQRPQLLRPLLPQRPRPHRRHLPDHRPRLLPEPRHQGRVRPASAAATSRPPCTSATRIDARPARTSTSAPTGSRSSSRCDELRRRARGDRGHRLRPAPGRARSTVVQEQPHVMRAGQPGTSSTRSGSPRSAPGRARSSIDGEDIAVDPGPLGRHAATARGASGPSARPSPPGAPGRPAVRGHVVALRADALRRLRASC